MMRNRTIAKRPILKEGFPAAMNGGADGIFDYIPNTPWSAGDNPLLDRMLYLNHGRRIAGPVLDYYMTDPSDREYYYSVEDTDKPTIGEMLWLTYGIKWNHIYKAVTAEYNPIDNYSMTEVETGSGTVQSTEQNNRQQAETSGRASTAETTRADALSRELTGTNNDTIERTRDETEARTNGTQGTTSAKDGEQRANTLQSDKEVTGENSEKQSQTAVNSGTTHSKSTNNGTGQIFGFNSSSAVNKDATTDNGTSDAETAQSASTLTDNAGTRTDKQSGTDVFNENLSRERVETVETTGSDTRSTAGKDAESHTGQSGMTEETTNNSSQQVQSNERANRSLSDIGSNETSETTANNRTLNRRGNIGVTTTAQMIAGEIELWKYNFYKAVVKDVADFLCVGVY